MNKDRLVAFSDGVFAIIITIMVLEMKIPKGNSWAALQPVLPIFLAYAFSFLYVGIYWNNHHHLFHIVHQVNGKVLWANLFLLFCLSLFPFAIAWMGENHLNNSTVALYGIILLAAGLAFYLLAHILIKMQGRDSALAKAYGKDIKTKISLIIYAIGIILSFFHPWMSIVLYIAVAVIWFIPDKRIEKKINR